MFALNYGMFFYELEAMICVPAQQHVENILLELTVIQQYW